MDTAKAQTLAAHRDDLIAWREWAAGALNAIEKNEFSLTHVRKASAYAWFVRAAPPLHIQERFGLAPEVLIVLGSGEIQAKTIQAAADEVVTSGLRLDANLLVVCDEAAGTLRSRLDRIPGHGLRLPFIPRGEVWPKLSEVMLEGLPSFDAFEERDPVRGPQLIGRGDEVAELRSRVSRGDAVALVGLRKMGKTSIMRAMTDTLDPASGLRESHPSVTIGKQVALVVDAGTVLKRNADALADELLGAWRRRARVESAQLDTVGRGLEGLKTVGERLLEGGHSLCVVIDEYDLLFEGEDGETSPFAGLGRFFRLLRGWAQMHQGAMSLVLVGRDPEYLGHPTLDGVTSPLLAWCTPMWIGPLSEKRAAELLRKIGRRVGLEIGHGTTGFAYRWTGGHPLLHRQFGSALRSTIRMTDQRWAASTDPRCDAALPAFLERDAVVEVVREIVALLRKRYPGALERLTALTRGKPLSRASSRDAVMLERFGLIDPSGSIWESLEWYMRDVAALAAPSREAV